MKNKPKRESKNLLCPKAGTATSSPVDKTASQSNMNIVNVMLWMKRNAKAKRYAGKLDMTRTIDTLQIVL
jgi:hypothetical protein